MAKEFMNPLTILVSGSANSTIPNIEDNLVDWIFSGLDERDVKLVVIYKPDMGKGMSNFLKWGQDFFQWGQEDGDPLYGIVMPEGGHRSISNAVETRAVETPTEAIGVGIAALQKDMQEGREVAVVSFYNPEDEFDLNLITVAKHDDIQTFDLSMGMVDFFEGYESMEDRLAREEAEDRFAQDQLEKSLDEKPVAKKATTPRKRAAKKTVAPKPTDALQEAEKPLQDVPEPKSKGPNPHRDPLPGNPTNDLKALHRFSTHEGGMGWTEGTCLVCGTDFANPSDTCVAKDVWSDVAKEARYTKALDNVSVAREDLAQLGEDIKNLGLAFAATMDTYSKIVRSI